GVGPLLATALVASVADPKTFRSGRNFSAWIGLVPKQHSSGGRDRLGSISKQGDRYLRSLFVAGALAVIRYAQIHGSKHGPWLTALLARRPTKLAAIALAKLRPHCTRQRRGSSRDFDRPKDWPRWLPPSCQRQRPIARAARMRSARPRQRRRPARTRRHRRE